MLVNGDKPTRGFVKRERPVWPEFISHASWWPVQEHQLNGGDGMVYLWIPKADNAAYERGHRRTRFCRTYRRVKILRKSI